MIKQYRKMIGLAALLALPLFAAGCSPTSMWEPPLSNAGIDVWKDKDPALHKDESQVGRRNLAFYQQLMDREYKYIPSLANKYVPGRDPASLAELERPGLCLALSGGGMRSAAFSIGVMKGLQMQGILKDVDMISSVSGGSYAVSWYYSQRLQEYFPDDDSLFGLGKEPPKCQHCNELGWKLEERAGLAAPGAIAVNILVSIPTIILNFVFDGLASSVEVMVSPAQDFYRNQLYRIFQARDIDKDQDQDQDNLKEKHKNVLTMSSMQTKLLEGSRSPKMPYPIINVTASARWFDPIAKVSPVHEKYLHEVFEITPDHIGSEPSPRVGVEEAKYNRKPCRPFYPFIDIDQATEVSLSLKEKGGVPLDWAVAMSGSAVDLVGFAGGSGLAARALLMLNFNLGESISIDQSLAGGDVCYDPRYDGDNPKESNRYDPVYDRNQILLTDGIPIVNYVFASMLFQRPDANMAWHLSDGGHSENLGAYSAIKRLCQHILVVDAGQDDQLIFDDYHSLKKLLTEQTGLEIDLPRLEEVSNRGEGSPGKVYTLENPVFRGKIDKIPVKFTSKKESETIPPIDVTLLKLSMNLDWIKSQSSEKDSKKGKYCDNVYGRYVQKYVEKEENARERYHYPDDCPNCFPQESTLDQDYSEDQFNAYRDLGCRLTEMYLKKGENGKLLDNYEEAHEKDNKGSRCYFPEIKENTCRK